MKQVSGADVLLQKNIPSSLPVTTLFYFAFFCASKVLGSSEIPLKIQVPETEVRTGSRGGHCKCLRVEELKNLRKKYMLREDVKNHQKSTWPSS